MSVINKPDEKPIEDYSPLSLVHPQNPFKAVRMQMGLTQVKVASRCGISKHAVLRNEQGMAVEPLPVLVRYFSEHFPVSAYELRYQYERYQVYVRTTNTRLLGPTDSFTSSLIHWEHFCLSSPSQAIHPLKYLRLLAGGKALNITAFSKKLCINQSVVNYFETQPINQKTVPEQLLVALKDAGYTNEELEYLCKCYDKYREILIVRQRILESPVDAAVTP